MAASLFADRRRGYLRFAAILAAALALAVLAQGWIPGIAQAAALIVLPLAGAALSLAALARFATPPPPLFATLCLVLALGCSLAALLGGRPALSLLPLAAGGAAAMIVALSRGAPIAALAGALLLAGTCAFFARGVAAPGAGCCWRLRCAALPLRSGCRRDGRTCLPSLCHRAAIAAGAEPAAIAWPSIWVTKIGVRRGPSQNGSCGFVSVWHTSST